MKITFTGSITELKTKLAELGGEWQDNPNMHSLRVNGGIMNWYGSTGTLQFQGKSKPKAHLEGQVAHLIYPDQYAEPKPEELSETTKTLELPETTATISNESDAAKYLHLQFDQSELIIGLVSAVGTETSQLTDPLNNRLKQYGYEIHEIKVSSLLKNKNDSFDSEYDRIRELMRRGDSLRGNTNKDNSILAKGACKLIADKRIEGTKNAYIIDSLKRPEEVELLRRVYGNGFYLIGIHSDEARRLKYLEDEKGLTQPQTVEITKIDEDEGIKHGQRTRDTYHLADFFVSVGANNDFIKNSVARFLELIFGNPHKNPTFDEFAMFMAFSSSLRSGDLSRQVGAVICKNDQIIATGANECPKSGGGHYWAKMDKSTGEVTDEEQGKDYTRKEDSNKREQNSIIEDIANNLIINSLAAEADRDKLLESIRKTRIADLTEYGRAVHAEMEALLSCSREGISTRAAALYCTTFPCHNCAKHIIDAGIFRVVYVEPYPKSKALELHGDSIMTESEANGDDNSSHVKFVPFTGVGVRRFLDLFSMSLGSGAKLKRKDEDGSATEWSINKANARIPLVPVSYKEVESCAAENYAENIKELPSYK